MPPSITRRAFVQLFSLPALAFLWPRAVRAQEPRYDGLTFTDSEGTVDLTLLSDNNLATGVEYQP